jgi:hypothetical protein
MMANHKEFERYDMKVERNDLAYSIYLPTSPRGAIMKQYIIPPRAWNSHHKGRSIFYVGSLPRKVFPSIPCRGIYKALEPSALPSFPGSITSGLTISRDNRLSSPPPRRASTSIL